jgi:hypothetical protein
MHYSHNGQTMSTLSVPAGAWEELRREVSHVDTCPLQVVPGNTYRIQPPPFFSVKFALPEPEGTHSLSPGSRGPLEWI